MQSLIKLNTDTNMTTFIYLITSTLTFHCGLQITEVVLIFIFTKLPSKGLTHDWNRIYINNSHEDSQELVINYQITVVVARVDSDITVVNISIPVIAIAFAIASISLSYQSFI